MALIEKLWQQVVEAPEDIGLRLVLADALIEAGDARGELIALQCRGADASVVVGGGEVLEANVAERISELVVANWDRWLGDAAALLVRQGSTFADGMLSVVQVGSEATPPEAWAKFTGHRELVAVRRVRPFKIRPDHYAMFLAALPHDPPSVEVHLPDVIRQLRRARKRWGIRHLRFGGISWWTATEQRGRLTSEFAALAELAPELETIEFLPTWGVADELVAITPRLGTMFPKLQEVRLEDWRTGWLGESAALIAGSSKLIVLD